MLSEYQILGFKGLIYETANYCYLSFKVTVQHLMASTKMTIFENFVYEFKKKTHKMLLLTSYKINLVFLVRKNDIFYFSYHLSNRPYNKTLWSLLFFSKIVFFQMTGHKSEPTRRKKFTWTSFLLANKKFSQSHIFMKRKQRKLVRPWS